MTNGATDRVRAHLDAHRAAMIDELASWVRIPSVDGVPEHEIDVARSAQWLASALRETGFPDVRTPGKAVVARWHAAAGAPHVVVYSHHDVRAAKDEEWQQTAPFEPVLREGRLYGRGASDAKGQVLAHVWGLRAHLAATGRAAPAVNLTLLVEGEEETGSAGLADLLGDLGGPPADLVVFSDTLMWRADAPAVCTSLRGLVNATLEVRGPLNDVHGGAVSGAAPNPITELGRLIGALHDADGRVALPGFYDSVLEPSARTRADLAALPYSDDDWLARSHARGITGEAGWTVLERLWTRPSIELMSIVGGDPVGPSRGTVPAVATAQLGVHLVDGQDPHTVGKQLRAFVAATIGDAFDHELTVAIESATPPYRTPAGHPAVAALADAMGEGFGAPAGRMGNAGAGPAALLADTLDAAVVFFGTGLIEDRWHDSDESASIDVLVDGARTLACLWPRLADLDRRSRQSSAP